MSCLRLSSDWLYLAFTCRPVTHTTRHLLCTPLFCGPLGTISPLAVGGWWWGVRGAPGSSSRWASRQAQSGFQTFCLQNLSSTGCSQNPSKEIRHSIGAWGQWE